MSGLLFGGAVKRLLTTNAARMLTSSRGAVSADCRRTLTTSRQLASRESDLHRIAMHNRPTNLDRKLLVLTRVFKSEDDIPDTLPITQINRARDIVRITVSCLIMVLFIIAVPFYMASGRRTRDRGETEWKRSKEWVAKLRREKMAEEQKRAEAEAAKSSS
ncbi:hypothetical protein LSAT2_007850 [Lamellibrachia satsuma]|nr:hypothetical protein LSAT2_007850 [Lamellibrachia satsuma]